MCRAVPYWASSGRAVYRAGRGCALLYAATPCHAVLYIVPRSVPSCAALYQPCRAVPCHAAHLPSAALPQLPLQKPRARELGRALPSPPEAHACFGVLPAAWWGPPRLGQPPVPAGMRGSRGAAPVNRFLSGAGASVPRGGAMTLAEGGSLGGLSRLHSCREHRGGLWPWPSL